jgi:enamine deaminase RidA (YjgF/YER057c/UK114 family)
MDFVCPRPPQEGAISCSSPLAPNDSGKSLMQRYGKDAVVQELPGAEGETYNGLVLLPRAKDRRIEVSFTNDAMKRATGLASRDNAKGMYSKTHEARQANEISRRDAHTAQYAEPDRSLQPYRQSWRTHMDRRHCRCRSGDRTELAGADIGTQTRQILKSFMVMLEAVGSDLDHIAHINIFLKHMSDFEAMNAAYVEIMGDRRPARTAFSVQDLPKPGALLTMNLTAVTRERSG